MNRILYLGLSVTLFCNLLATAQSDSSKDGIHMLNIRCARPLAFTDGHRTFIVDSLGWLSLSEDSMSNGILFNWFGEFAVDSLVEIAQFSPHHFYSSRKLIQEYVLNNIDPLIDPKHPQLRRLIFLDLGIQGYLYRDNSSFLDFPRNCPENYEEWDLTWEGFDPYHNQLKH